MSSVALDEHTQQSISHPVSLVEPSLRWPEVLLYSCRPRVDRQSGTPAEGICKCERGQGRSCTENGGPPAGEVVRPPNHEPGEPSTPNGDESENEHATDPSGGLDTGASGANQEQSEENQPYDKRRQTARW